MTWQLRMTPEQVAAHQAKVGAARVHLADADERGGKPLPKSAQDLPEAPQMIRIRSAAAPVSVEPQKPVRRLEISLPYPPSVNHYWLTRKGGGRFISDEGRNFRAQVKLRAGNSRTVLGRVAITVQAYPPDKRFRDLDNVFKSLLDALSHAAIIEDDGLIDDLRIIRKEQVKGGRVYVCVRAI